MEPAPPRPLRPPGSARAGRSAAGTLVPLAFYALLLALAWKVFFGGFGPLFDPRAEPRPVTPRGDLAADEQATIELFESASPSVVHITTLRRQRSFGLLGMTEKHVPEGAGTGFLWTEEGHVVTNYHVVRSADAGVDVQLGDGSWWSARLVGVAPDYDLAVLKIDAPSRVLAPILVGTSTDLKVGQKVFAIGNPFGLSQTLTTGVISGLDRSIQSRGLRPIEGVIQTDAAINPGNSGGPLLDSAGRLIGVNTAIYSPTGASAGVGFAVPVDTVNRVVPQIVRGAWQGERPALGVFVAPDEVAQSYGVDEGVMIVGLVEGGSAERVGLESWRQDDEGNVVPGDVVVGIEDREVRTRDELYAALETFEPGDEVRVLVRRGTRGAPREVRVVLQSREPRLR